MKLFLPPTLSTAFLETNRNSEAWVSHGSILLKTGICYVFLFPFWVHKVMRNTKVLFEANITHWFLSVLKHTMKKKRKSVLCMGINRANEVLEPISLASIIFLAFSLPSVAPRQLSCPCVTPGLEHRDRPATPCADTAASRVSLWFPHTSLMNIKNISRNVMIEPHTLLTFWAVYYVKSSGSADYRT